jgi:RNA-binding protein
MMDTTFKKELRAKANNLKCLMSVGKAGVTDAVIAGVDKLLEHHELLKLRMLMDEADDAELAGMEIAQRTASEMVARVGKVVILYKPGTGE